MKWIKEYKQRYSFKVFKKRSKKVKFAHSFVAMENAITLGFIININSFSSKDLIILTDYITKLEEHGKKVFLIELNFKRKTEPMFNETNKTIFINPAHISWLGFPSREMLQQINRYKCDILVNLDTSESMTSRFICGLSNAKTRAGAYEEGFEGFYELMVELKPETKLKALLKHFEMYLKMIKNGIN